MLRSDGLLWTVSRVLISLTKAYKDLSLSRSKSISLLNSVTSVFDYLTFRVFG